MWVVKVTVRVDFAEEAQTQPTEVLSTRGARHLVTAVHFLQKKNKALAKEVSASIIVKFGPVKSQV